MNEMQSITNKINDLPVEIQRQIVDYIDFLASKYKSNATSTEKPLILSSEVERKVDIARQQVKNGQVLTHIQANKEIDEWLNAQ